MSATQVSFAEFALASIAPALAVESTPPAESMPGPSLDAGLVAHASVGGGECPDIGHLCALRWSVRDAHGGYLSNGYFVLLSLSHAHGGLGGCLDNTDRVQAYDTLLSAASHCISAGC